MLQFGVAIEGVTKPNQAFWVLAVEGERLLVAHDDSTLHWHPMSKCKLALFVNPAKPLPVIALQAEPQIVKAKGILDLGLDGRRQ